MRVTPRIVFAVVFLACAGLIALALFLQEQEGLEPCPMCILQRYAFVAGCIVALAGAVYGPRAVAPTVYAALVALLAIAGGGGAVPDACLHHFPPDFEFS